MAKKFVRGVTDVENIESFDKTLTNVNDILSDGQDTYVHTKKGKNESYYKLTDSVKELKSTDDTLTFSKEDGTVSIANSGLATKQELAGLATKVEQDVATVEQDIATVEQDIATVKDNITHAILLKSEEFELGSVTGNTPVANTARARTKNMLRVFKGDVIKFQKDPTLVNYGISISDLNGVWRGVDYGWFNQPEFIIEEDSLIRLTVRYVDNRILDENMVKTLTENTFTIARTIKNYIDNELNANDIKLPTSGKIPINRYKTTLVNQDATKVGNEYWLFDGSSPDHASTASIHRVNQTDFSEIGLITHNLGHANGVDYIDNTLLVYNGGAFPPEINLYKNPNNTMTNLNVQDAANTQIIFKESNKLLPGDGSACFGIDKKIVYYAYSSGGAQVTILKILLGLGDNDLSDKTADKSDNQHWGSFVSGKSSDDYNGTAQIIKSYTGNIPGDTQPQGMAFNGDLYLGASHSEQKAYQLQLLDDGSFKVLDSYKSEMTDYKNNIIYLEPEITFIDPVKRSLFVGARGGNNYSLSNVAEFNL